MNQPAGPTYREFVVEQLGRVAPPIRAKSMFGGTGLYSRDTFFALIAGDELYLKVDDSNRPDFEARGSGPFLPYGAGSGAMQYYLLPPDVLEDVESLRLWVEKSIAVARGKKKPKSSAKKKD
jgi:DNA transformation protein